MSKKLTITIGIPAYNEELSISAVLHSVLNQKQDFFSMKEIIVVSDASTDKTEEIVGLFSDPRIRFLKMTKRSGQSKVQNLIISEMSKDSDALFLIEADTILGHDDCINKLVQSVPVDGVFSIVCARHTPLPARNFFEKVMNAGFDFRMLLYEKASKHISLYLCTSARLLSKKFLGSFRWDENYHEDSYCYRQAVLSGLPIIADREVPVYFKSVSNLKDYYLQSGKFQKAKDLESKTSSIYSVKFNRPRLLLTVLRAFISNPVLLSCYALVVFGSRLNSIFLPTYDKYWEIYKSSKPVGRF